VCWFPFSLPYPFFLVCVVWAFCGCGKLGVGLGSLWKEVLGVERKPAGSSLWVWEALVWFRKVARLFLVFVVVLLGFVSLPVGTSAYLFLPLCPVA